MNIQSLGLMEPIVRAVVAKGYQTATPIQQAAIPLIMSGRDLLGCAQTGTGKTAAFVLPLLHRLTAQRSAPGAGKRQARGLILAPTRELAAQIGDSIRAYGRYTGLRHTVIYGGVGQHAQVRNLQRGVDIIVATPGRLIDLQQQGCVDLRRVECLVLDEADRMLDMGFLPDMHRIIARLPQQRQTLLLSATLPPPIEALTRNVLRNPAKVRIAPQESTSVLVSHTVYIIASEQKSGCLIKQLQAPSVERAIVFTRTKRGADRLARNLERVGLRAAAIHGNKSQSARSKILARFRSPRPPILVATDVAARGIDVAGISHVFNYDLPDEPETYVHRIGRTGRAGAQGAAITFCEPAQQRELRDIERLLSVPLKIENEPSRMPQVSALPKERMARSAQEIEQRDVHPQGPPRRPVKYSGRRGFRPARRKTTAAAR